MLILLTTVHELNIIAWFREAARAVEKLSIAIVEPSERPLSGVKPDAGAFLRVYMLGIVANLSDMLQDVQGRKSDESKRKVLRGLTAFVSAVGPSINAVAPQVGYCCTP